MQYTGTASEHSLRLVVVMSVRDSEGAQIGSRRESVLLGHMCVCTLTFFQITQILCFDQKIQNNLINFYIRISSPGVENTSFILTCGCQHHYATIMLSPWQSFKILLNTDRSNFAKTILFENCSCFSKIPFNISAESPWIFQYLISIPAGHWLRPVLTERYWNWFSKAGTLCQEVTFSWLRCSFEVNL